MNLTNHPRIWIDKNRMNGKPCIRGTRVPVETIGELLSAGQDRFYIISQYPTLSSQDVSAAEEFLTDPAVGA